MKLIVSDNCCKLVEFLITFYKGINLERNEDRASFIMYFQAELVILFIYQLINFNQCVY